MKGVSNILPCGGRLCIVGVGNRALLRVVRTTAYSLPSRVNTFPRISKVHCAIGAGIPCRGKGRCRGSACFTPTGPKDHIAVRRVNKRPFSISGICALIAARFVYHNKSTCKGLARPKTISVRTVNCISARTIRGCLGRRLGKAIPTGCRGRRNHIAIVG